MMGDENGGIIFIGTKGKIMTGCYGMNPTLLPVSDMEHFNQPKPSIPRVKGGNGNIWATNAHEQDWIRACKESPENRVESSSNFQFSGPFNEMVVMGVLAVRLSGLHGLHRELLWDGENMKFTNISPTDTIKIVTVDDFKVVGVSWGQPTTISSDYFLRFLHVRICDSMANVRCKYHGRNSHDGG